MAGKRSSATRAPAEAVRSGRPRCVARSTYATAENEDTVDEQPVVDQAPPVEEQPEPTTV